MNYPKVSIIILNWNGLKDTIECLESLKKITYPNYEVIVVDNGSEGNDADILEEKYKGYIRLIRNKENLGFTGGNNIAIKKIFDGGKSNYILLLNNDTVVEPNFLLKLVEIAENNPEVGVIGPKIVLYDQPDKLAHGRGVINWRSGSGIGKEGEGLLECDFVTGCAMLIKKSALEKLDYFFDDDYFTYYEDADLCLRIKDKGFKIIYYSGAKVRHKVGISTGMKEKSSKFIYYYIRNKFLFMHKNANLFQKAFFFSSYLIFGVPRFILRLFFQHKRIKNRELRLYLKAIKDGLAKRGGKLLPDEVESND